MDRERVEALDGRDPLAGFRERFVFAGDPDVIYLDGNSLGRMPVAGREAIETLVLEWAERLVAGWDGWLDLPRRVGDRLGAVALGAAAGQVLVCDSTTVNLFKLASAALDGLSRPDATRIVTDAGNFPTDRYVLEGLAKQRGLTLELIDADEVHGPGVPDVDTEGLALLVLSHVGYRSGAVADLRAITEHAGAPVVWDLSHSVGALPIELDRDGVQLAVGCTYKYLNGGPGAPAFMYVRRELQERLRSPVQGWFGQRDQFAMDQPYEPERDIRRFLAGTPAILQLAGVAGAVEQLGEIGLDAVRTKNTALTALMVELYDEWLAPLGFGLATPRDPRRRGSHVCLRHQDAQALIGELAGEHKVIGDFRGPDRLRFGLAAPYTRFVDVYDAMARLRTLAEGRR